MKKNHYPDWAIGAGEVLDKLVADEEQGKIQASQQKDERTKALLSTVEQKRKIKAGIMAAKSSLKDDEIKAEKEKKERVARLEAKILKEKKEKAIQAEIDKVKALMTPEEKAKMEAAQLEAKKKKEEEEKKKKAKASLKLDEKGEPVIISEIIEGKLVSDGTVDGIKVFDATGKEIELVLTATLDTKNPGKVVITRYVKITEAAKDAPQGVDPNKAKVAPIDKEKAGKELPTDKKLNDPADKKSAGMTAEETFKDTEEEKKINLWIHFENENDKEKIKEIIENRFDVEEGDQSGHDFLSFEVENSVLVEGIKEYLIQKMPGIKFEFNTSLEAAKAEAAKVLTKEEQAAALKAAIQTKRVEGEDFKKKLEAAPKLEEEDAKKVKDEKITKETTRFQKTTKTPEEVKKITEEAEPISEDEKALFEGIVMSINKLTELTNAKQAQMKEVTDAFKDPELALSKATEQAIENYYNHAKVNNKLGDIAKLAEDKFVGVYERIKPGEKKYTKEEQAKIDKIEEEIKALKEKKKELDDLVTKYKDYTREITVLELEKKPKQTIVKTSINAEDQAAMVENAESIEKGTNVLTEIIQVLKDIFKIGNNIDKLAPASVAASQEEIDAKKTESLEKQLKEKKEKLVKLKEEKKDIEKELKEAEALEKEIEEIKKK